MRRPLLALFRGADGRSLAWALALLLVVNSFVAGSHAALAAAEPDTVLCAVGHAEGGSELPAAHADPCCLAGCQVPVPAAAPPSAAIVTPRLVSLNAVAAETQMGVRHVAHDSGHPPRGPPFLA